MYIENSWVIQLHQALHEMGGKLLLHQFSSGILQRVNDQFIMDAIPINKIFLPTIRRINYCRLYLRVRRLSDIVTNDGLRV